jgi:hypothetical protein
VTAEHAAHVAAARLCDANVGRFVSEDWVDTGHTLLYAYVHDRPLLFVDPEGLCDREVRQRKTDAAQEATQRRMRSRNMIANDETSRWQMSMHNEASGKSG